MRARARLTRLERAARTRRLDDFIERMTEGELAAAVDLTRKWLAAPGSLSQEESERFAALASRFVAADERAAG